MTADIGEDDLDVAMLNSLLESGGCWRHGTVTSIDSEPIGADYGFSGRSYRLHLTTASSGVTTVVAKFEDTEHITRAVRFRDLNEMLLSGRIPESYGARVDGGAGRGVILLEDISPAVQGDDLKGCSPAAARTIVDLIAHLHGSTWQKGCVHPDGASDDWGVREWEPARWIDRLGRARASHRDRLSPELVDRLEGIPQAAADAYDDLSAGPRCWIHHDPHPDNALWRPDGSLVMLDWSNAVVGPPAVDVAAMLQSFSFRVDPSLPADDVLAMYAAGLKKCGVDRGQTEVAISARRALVLLIRGMIGWAGQDTHPPPTGRNLALRQASAARAAAAITWLDR